MAPDWASTSGTINQTASAHTGPKEKVDECPRHTSYTSWLLCKQNTHTLVRVLRSGSRSRLLRLLFCSAGRTEEPLQRANDRLGWGLLIRPVIDLRVPMIIGPFIRPGLPYQWSRQPLVPSGDG